jgi:hypothetical protein
MIVAMGAERYQTALAGRPAASPVGVMVAALFAPYLFVHRVY